MLQEHANIKIKEFTPKKNLKGYTLIEGFPGIGLVGTIAAKYLIEKLEFKKFGCIDADIFIPIIRVRDGKPVHPSRVFINEGKKLITIISEQIIPNQFMDDFSRAIVQWTQEKGIKKVIALSGIHTDSANETRKVYGIAANEKGKKLLKKYNVQSIEEGVTSGITALILLELKQSNLEAVSLLGEVKMVTDYKAAASVLKKLNEILQLRIDIKPLLKESKEVEAELTKFLEKIKEEKEKAKQLSQEPPPSGSPYYA